MAKTMEQRMFTQQRRRIYNMRASWTAREQMERAVWLALQTSTHLQSTAHGYIAPDIAAHLWLRLQPFFLGDPALEAAKGSTARPRRARVTRISGGRRVLIDAAKTQRREDYFRRGYTYDGAPIEDPAYDAWLAKHGMTRPHFPEWDEEQDEGQAVEQPRQLVTA